MRTRLPVLAAVLCAGALAATAGPAAADPPFRPDSSDITVVGAQTGQELGNALAAAYNNTVPTPIDRLASYDATGSSTITPKVGCPTIPRPRTANQGIAALVADTTGCVDAARSDRYRSETDASEGPLAFLPYAYDGVSFVVSARSNAPMSLSAAQLHAIYSCAARTWNKVGGRSTQRIQPLLPPAGTPTRTFFLSAIDVATPGSCVRSAGSDATDRMREGGDDKGHGDDRVRNLIAPLSVPTFIQLGKRSRSVRDALIRLGSLRDADGNVVPPVVTDPTTGAETFNTGLPEQFIRPLYNVVKRSTDPTQEGVPARLGAVFGFGGYVCSDDGQAVVVGQGYGSLPKADGCGVG